MSVKGSLVSKGSSASTASAPMAAVPAPKACWEMELHVLVSASLVYTFMLWDIENNIFIRISGFILKFHRMMEHYSQKQK